MDFLAPMVVMVTMLLTIGGVLRQVVVNRRIREVTRTNAELQLKLIDKVSGTADLAAYLASDAGRKFLEAASVEPTSPHRRILGSIQTGILLLAAGFALYVSRGQVDGDARNLFAVLGLFAGVLGLGFLASSAVVHQLSRRWGLFASGAPAESAEG